MEATIIYSDALTAYDFGPAHPLRPERFSGAVKLMREHGLLGPDSLRVLEPVPAARAELELVHSPGYVDAVLRASEPGASDDLAHGIGRGDTPVFPGMYDAAALVAGSALGAMREVLAGRAIRALAPAGGLHHAHRDRAAGFCVFNDPAIAIAAALAEDPGLRLAYIDIDAHHGDGVQEAFWNEPRVLTVSVHESGRYLFPGTGFPGERGGPEAPLSAVNVPMPPFATDACYERVTTDVIVPVVTAFHPDLIVSQNGADALHADPLTTLGLTVRGYAALVRRISALSHELCGGRLVALGGGGYAWERAVPVAWTALAASIIGRDLPDSLLADSGPGLRYGAEEELLERTAETIAEVMAGRAG